MKKMKIKDFGVEMWMNQYETSCRYNLAETCVASLTVQELLEMAGDPQGVQDQILKMRLTYGDIEGSDRLRNTIASLYRTAKKENIAITHGAIGANAILMLTLVEPGDHVISVLPTYQQLYSIPESIGAKVDILRLRPENGYLPDLQELRKLAEGGVKLICINNPNNPTGAVMDEAYLRQIVDIAREHDAWLLCDEVYRGLVHEGEPFTASVFDLYPKAVSTGSLSKTYSLAGLRMGWVAAPVELVEKIAHQRDYHIISCGMINDLLAALALENRDKIVERNLGILRHNKEFLTKWVENEPHITWMIPQGGTTALLCYDMDLPSEEFCRRLQEETGVMLLPGAVMEMEHTLRIGYGNTPEIIEAGLVEMGKWLRQFD